jgi:hypothetical protein
VDAFFVKGIFMGFLRKIERNLATLVMMPLVGFEAKGREKRLQERLNRLQNRQLRNSV